MGEQGEYDHLTWSREADPTDRRRRGPPRPRRPDDPAAHAGALLAQFGAADAAAAGDEPGFDERRLLKLRFDGHPPEGLWSFPGIEVVSEEGGELALVFATEEGRAEFENRLRLVQRGQHATRREVLFAMDGIDAWTPEDRTSVGLRDALQELRQVPDQRVRLDVELWPLSLDRPEDAERMFETFRLRAERRGVLVLDSTRRPVVLLRVEASLEGVEWMLRYRDVRIVDVPPRFLLEPQLRRLALSELEEPTVEPDAPLLAVLDSGVATNHPLLAPAVAHAESFLDGSGPDDGHGHGTRVAGIAVFGDVEAAAVRRSFHATARVLSGRVLDGSAQYDDKLIENQVREAVEVFGRDFGCRIFTLSLGDARHPHDGGRLRPFAMTLDDLAREHGVLFIVSSGNYGGSGAEPADWRGEYPRYLLSDAARILDPAPALNALTVGSIARHELALPAARSPRDPSHQPIARRDQPSPFTRGGAANGPIKPELVEHGGNLAVDIRAGTTRAVQSPTLGVLSTNHGFAAGDLFAVDIGTSFAAPAVANLAARILGRYPDASAELLRPLLVAHADVPAASAELLERPELVRLTGYGIPRADRCLSSSERIVTLLAEDTLRENETHFFEIPLPDDFTEPPVRRARRVRVAIAHTPLVRPGRAEYRASRLAFRVVRSSSLDTVRSTFQRGSTLSSISENGLWPSPKLRDRGTVQAAVWDIRQTNRRWAEKRPFLVVSRTVPRWAEGLVPAERYACVAIVEDRSEAPVRLYTQLRARLRARARVRR